MLVTLKDGKTVRATMADYLHEHFDQELDVEVADLTDSEILDTIEYTLFPNTFLFPGLTLPMVYQFRPMGMDPDRCLFDLLYLRPIPRSGEHPDSAKPWVITKRSAFAIFIRRWMTIWGFSDVRAGAKPMRTIAGHDASPSGLRIASKWCKA